MTYVYGVYYAWNEGDRMVYDLLNECAYTTIDLAEQAKIKYILDNFGVYDSDEIIVVSIEIKETL